MTDCPTWMTPPAVIATSSKSGNSTATGSDQSAAGDAASLTIETAAVKVTGTRLGGRAAKRRRRRHRDDRTSA